MYNRRFLFGDNFPFVDEVPFVKGQESIISVLLSSQAYDFIATKPYDFDKGVMLGTDDGSIKTYKTIIVNEYEWMSENLMCYFANRMGTSLEWTNFTQDIIDKMNQSYEGKPNVSLDRFLTINGSYFSNYDTALAYRKGYKVFDSKNNVSLDWRLPTLNDFSALVGYAPRLGHGVFDAVKNFIYASYSDVGLDYGGSWFDSDNLSGIGLTPLGGRHSGEAGENGQTFYAYKEQCNLRLSDTDTSQIVFSLSKGVSYYNTLYHLGQVRYCRPLTSSELGYKICVDEKLDRLLCLDVDDRTSLPELEQGFLRGVSLRYLDKSSKLFLLSLSELRAIVNKDYLDFFIIAD